MKVAAFIGKFYPPHIGHLAVVDKFAKSVDELWIIISYNSIRNKIIENQSGFKNLSPYLIKQWFENHYKNNSKIVVEVFDETGFRPYPEDRDKWAEKFKKEFPKINIKIADESYREFNNQYFSEYEFLPLSRDIVNIHSTEIRKDLLKHLDKIIPEARDYFKGGNHGKV